MTKHTAPRKATAEPLPKLTFHPLTPERWPDLEKPFGKNGACGGCWCMWLKLPRKEFVAGKGEANREALKAIVAAGEVPGILTYARGKPVGWCAVAPRDKHPIWDRSRNFKRIDDEPVWSISCFFIAKPYRRRGMSRLLIGGGRIREAARRQNRRGLPDRQQHPDRRSVCVDRHVVVICGGGVQGMRTLLAHSADGAAGVGKIIRSG